MKRGLVIIGVLALMAGSTNAAIVQGQYELGALVSISSSDYTDGSTRDVFSLDLDASKFVTDNLSMGIDIGGDWREASSSIQLDQYHLGIKGKYHVYTNQVLVPYFGVTLGLADFTSKTKLGSSTTNLEYDGYYYGPILGGRYELNQSNDLYLELQYKFYNGNIKDDFGMDKECKLMIGILHQFN